MANLRDSVRQLFSGVYAIVDDVSHADYGLERLLRDIVLSSAISVVQLRLKKLDMAQCRDLAQFAASLKWQRTFILIVNDHEELLSVAGVDGLHVGQGDGDVAFMRERYPGHILGVSTHSLDEAVVAERAGADYIGCGAVCPTATKTGTIPLGLSGLKNIASAVRVPAVAIGGINESNIHLVQAAGASMAAVIGALTSEGCFAGARLESLWSASHAA